MLLLYFVYIINPITPYKAINIVYGMIHAVHSYKILAPNI